MTVKKTNFITLKKTAKKYFYAPNTLVNWARRDYILAVKQANKWYIEENSLIKYLECK